MKPIRTDPYLCTKKSGSQCLEVIVEGIPIVGFIDTGSDITITRGDQFYELVKETHLNMQHIEPTKQRDSTYNQKPMDMIYLWRYDSSEYSFC